VAEADEPGDAIEPGDADADGDTTADVADGGESTTDDRETPPPGP
jgi:hypothetical protein